HLAPDHLETALRFNPLATLPSGDKVAAAVGITP
ncbi:TPA: integrase, partial [Shigella boydii]|nr:integrase [Shigella boydii]HCS1938154.1 integrase [Shigella boydii]